MKKLAVIGGGIAGVSAAYLMQNNYEITLFESRHCLGGNNCSAEIENGIKLPLAVIIFPRRSLFINTMYYAEKFKLPMKRKAFPHVFSHENQIQYYFMHPFMSKDLSDKRLLQEIKDYWYLFFRFKHESVNSHKTISDLINEKKISEKCANYFLLPFASLYMSMPYSALFNLPISIIANWWTKYVLPCYSLAMYSYIQGGNQQLIEAFVKNTKMICRLKTKVLGIKRNPHKVTIYWENMSEDFDKVIIATQPDDALHLLEMPTSIEKEILGNIETGKVCSTLHTDKRFSYDGAITCNVQRCLNQKPTLVSTWGQNVFVEHHLKHEYYVSIHEQDYHFLNEKNIIHQEYFKVALPTSRTFKSLDNIHYLNKNELNTYFCGSYFNHFFYHEDAINSALDIAKLDNKL